MIEGQRARATATIVGEKVGEVGMAVAERKRVREGNEAWQDGGGYEEEN